MSNNYRIRIKKGETELEVEGDKEFVKELFEEFKTDMYSLPESKINSSQSIISQNGQIQLIRDKYTLQKLYKILNPTTNLDRIIIFGYWILKAEKIEEFSINDIINYFEKFKIKKPAYITRDFRKLVNPSKGYLIIGKTEGYYSLSYDGIQYIEEKLNKLEIEENN